MPTEFSSPLSGERFEIERELLCVVYHPPFSAVVCCELMRQRKVEGS